MNYGLAVVSSVKAGEIGRGQDTSVDDTVVATLLGIARNGAGLCAGS